jgi:hypothetical protein
MQIRSNVQSRENADGVKEMKERAAGHYQQQRQQVRTLAVSLRSVGCGRGCFLVVGIDVFYHNAHVDTIALVKNRMEALSIVARIIGIGYRYRSSDPYLSLVIDNCHWSLICVTCETMRMTPFSARSSGVRTTRETENQRISTIQKLNNASSLAYKSNTACFKFEKVDLVNDYTYR